VISLRRWLDREPIIVELSESDAARVREILGEAGGHEIEGSRPSRTRTMVIAAVLLALAVLVAAAILLWRSHLNEPRDSQVAHHIVTSE
jgi:hypothetical protein